MEEENKYIIKGGEEGKKRLDVIAEILNGHTKQLIEIDSSIEGKRFLDVGSGGGSVSLMASHMVGAKGSVTAIDFDNEIIELSKADAKSLNVENIFYRALDAYELDYENEFDIAYSRFLLSHLQKPEIVLNKMVKSLKQGGRIIIEDIDFSGHFCFPNSEAFDSYLNYFVTAAKNNGQNPNIGLSLFELFKSEQIGEIKFDVIQPFYNDGKGKWMAYFTMDKIKETVIKQKLADSNSIGKLLLELKRFTEDKNSLISLPRIFRVWGVKH